MGSEHGLCKPHTWPVPARPVSAVRLLFLRLHHGANHTHRDASAWASCAHTAWQLSLGKVSSRPGLPESCLFQKRLTLDTPPRSSTSLAARPPAGASPRLSVCPPSAERVPSLPFACGLGLSLRPSFPGSPLCFPVSLSVSLAVHLSLPARPHPFLLSITCLPTALSVPPLSLSPLCLSLSPFLPALLCPPFPAALTQGLCSSILG